MAHWVLYALFSVGVVIELVSVYLDWRVMTGKGKTSGAWGVAFGFSCCLGCTARFWAIGAASRSCSRGSWQSRLRR